MAQQIKKKYIQDDAIDGGKLKLVKDQSVRGEDQQGQEVDLLKLNQDDKILLKGEEAALKSQVDTEQARAEGEETRIEGKVDQEVIDRIDGDANLQSQIDNIVSNVDPSALDSLSEIVDAFQSADSDLQQSITDVLGQHTSELNAYKASNDPRVTTLEGEMDAAEGRLDVVEADISQEIQDRTNADSTLQSNIDSEENSRIAGDADLESKIDVEKNRALASEADLLSQIQSNDSDIATLQSDLASEVSSRQSGDAALQTTIDAIQGLDNILFEDSGVNSSGNATVDPEGRDGWYYKNAGSGEKVYWYFFSSVDGEGNVVNPVTVEEFKGVYSVNSVEAGPEGDTFHMALYTTPQGDGNDASWYRSRRVYVPSEPFDREVKMLFYVGQEPDASVHPELPRMEMVESVVAGQQAGDFANSESMLYVAFSTNSASQAGSIELLVNALGFNSSVYNKEYSLQIRDNFSLSGIKDSVLSNQSQIEQNTAAIEALDGNFATDQELADEASARASADTTLQGNIDAEEAARQSADTTLQGNIDAEASARAAADTTLQSNIDVEKAARIDADSALQTSINTEKARIDAILDASEADKDSFAEIVTLINSVDTENDDAFAGYVTSNNAALAQEVSDRESGDTALDARIAPIEEILEYQKSSFYENNAAVYADASAGREDAQKRNGWYYENDGLNLGSSGDNKINWYFYDGQQQSVSLGDFSAYAVMTFDDASESPILSIYTFPTGTGDAASWYHSRSNYSGLSETPVVGKKYLVYVGQDPQIHPELPRLEIQKSLNTSVGDEASNEIVMTSAFGTNSIAPVSSVKFLVEHLGVYSPSFKSDVELKIRDASQVDLEAEEAARISGDADLQSQIDALDTKVSQTVQFDKETIEVTAQMIIDGYVDLQAEAKANSTVMFVGRLGMHEGYDYSVSVVDGVTRITFLAPMLTPEPEALEAGQSLYITYSK